MIHNLYCFGSHFHYQEAVIIFLEHPSNKPGSLLCNCAMSQRLVDGLDIRFLREINIASWDGLIPTK